MKCNKALVSAAALIIATLLPISAFCAEISGWIKGETCWVTHEPSLNSEIKGIILQRAAVTVEDIGSGWVKIIFAPVRDPSTGKYIDCSGCYFQKMNMTTVIPGKW